ncbi:hypothetical protein ABB55_08405 [Prosthecomicrobium hirschii]|uniref:histidine kinase n=1 Tax=Prosthecodimorpha hirschii TaxID=665126 RepID=A0A0P6VJR0_9HYPH|nr:ATP-binding protein [Prosthecomicrobium hirschii]KPL52250.1 hypothetical protein ABB55_08405 [Prosthecomicrobium hirschii]
MSLIVRITVRLAVVALIALAGTILWMLHATDARLQRGAEISVDRLERHWMYRPGLGSLGVTSSELLSGWTARASGSVVLPGVCILVSTPTDPDSSLCNARDGLGGTVPAWFATLFERFAAPREAVVREVVFRGHRLGTIRASVDTQAATEQAWQQVSLVAGAAAGMAAGMCLLAWLAVAHALRPVGGIVRALRDLEDGADGPGATAARLPASGTAEFDDIARAFNDLAARLEHTTEERGRLTRRLFAVQEEERRMLARELHDEFGQCLTAGGALAASIASDAPPARPDIARDAHSIGRLIADMQATLRGALARLRVPDLEEVGLAASLRSLVGSWNSHRGSRTRFLLDVEGDLGATPPAEALGIYRLVQECLTNAARHGDPATVLVRIRRNPGPPGTLTVTVEDDGGGAPERLSDSPGLGVTGMRERIRALGGRLSIGRSAGGLSISAEIPTAPAAPATLAAASTLAAAATLTAAVAS